VNVFLVLHRQRIEVGAQRQNGSGKIIRVGFKVADQTGSAGQSAWLETGKFEAFEKQLAGRELLSTQFRVSVDVATERDQAFAVFIEPLVENTS
jgi:hypothetical protein